MKKRILVLSLIMSLSMTVSAFAGIGVIIDGTPVHFTDFSGAPVVDENSRTLVPLRAAMEAYGCTVSWNQDTQTAVVTKDANKVEVPVGKKRILVNSAKVATDTQAKIIDGRVYLPIRAVLEAFGASVGWDQASQCVTVTSSSSEKAFPEWNILRKSTKAAETYMIDGFAYGFSGSLAALYATVPASGDTTWVNIYYPEDGSTSLERYIKLCNGDYSFNEDNRIVIDRDADECEAVVSGADIVFSYGRQSLTFINGSAIGNHTAEGVRMITYRLDDSFGCYVNATDLAEYFGIDGSATYDLNSSTLIIK